MWVTRYLYRKFLFPVKHASLTVASIKNKKRHLRISDLKSFGIKRL
jgi:hypothetical protein